MGFNKIEKEIRNAIQSVLDRGIGENLTLYAKPSEEVYPSV